MECSLNGPSAAARSLTVLRRITGGPLEEDHRYGSLAPTLQLGVHLQRGDRERAPLPERRMPPLEAMVC